jgi:hypothetical protein
MLGRDMPLETYKVLHIVGLAALALGFGGMLMAPAASDRQAPRFAVLLHGLGLLVLLVAGFGIMARLGFTSWPWPGWVLAKMGIWLLLGAMPMLLRRGIVPRPLGWLLVLGLVALAAWLALFKPI